ncbi:MAG: hypothetical protein SCK29_08895 [Bacillota bacterium]|nr:hypothetical protein [Bacillota bacterium]MDW7684216.1 hypothetical protein [Bacillota bacterium]
MSQFTMYRDMINETFESVSDSIGIHVMLIVVEHALWNTKNKYEEAACIQFSEEGINFDAMAELEEEKVRAIAHELAMTIIATLGRLVGKQLARQLMNDLQLTNAEEE